MMPFTDIAALILAAGQSRRMGDAKPLLSLGNETALERSVNLFANAGIHDIRVVTGHLAETIRQRLPELPVTWVHNGAFQQGMLSSIKRGAASIDARRAWFFLLPVDIPLVRPGTIATLLAARDTSNRKVSIFHPAFMGRRGHPPLISTKLIPGILAWNGSGGLGGFLSECPAESAEVPVIDEFIERDMDTPADYRSLSNALARYRVPTASECEAMLATPSLFPEQTAAHCRQVARLSAFLANRLTACDISIDIDRVTAAALLHDIGKGRKHHAEAGGCLLREMGYAGIADIVSSHMDIDVSDNSSLTEAHLVYLADKLVKGDTLVPLSVRFELKLAKYGHDSSARAAIIKRRSHAEAIAESVERAIGRSFQSLLDDFLRESS